MNEWKDDEDDGVSYTIHVDVNVSTSFVRLIVLMY